MSWGLELTGILSGIGCSLVRVLPRHTLPRLVAAYCMTLGGAGVQRLYVHVKYLTLDIRP